MVRMHRYLGLVWPSGDTETARHAQQLETEIRGSAEGWSVAFRRQNCVVLHVGARPHLAEAHEFAHQRGVVVGVLFDRRSEVTANVRHAATFSEPETHNILVSEGQHLVDRYWGRYVAFGVRPNGNAVWLLRDPTGEMPCYRIRFRNADVVFSHVDDCLRFLPVSFSINWKYVIARLKTGLLVNGDCGLNEVEVVPTGTTVPLSESPTASRKLLWDPRSFCEATEPPSSHVALHDLRNSVQTTVNALASCHSAVALRLSGGLDSSVIAGCLAHAPSSPTVTCINYYFDANSDAGSIAMPNVSADFMRKLRRVVGSSDERRFARLVASGCGFPLVEHERHVRKISFESLRAAPLSVVPTQYANLPDLDAAEIDIARDAQVTALFTGDVGDVVFCATLDPIAAIDYMYRHRFGPHLLREIFSAAALSHDSIWSVASAALKYGLFRRPKRPGYDRSTRPHFLNSEAAGQIDREYERHPWQKLADGLPPGKQSQIAGLVFGLHGREAYHRERYCPTVSPLASQPVVETCLRIPTYTLLDGGVSRGLARRAFGDVLPTEIKNRTTKGSASNVHQQLERENTALLKERLLGGVLSQEGILNTSKVAEALVSGQERATLEPGELMRCLMTEEWLRQWKGLRAQRAVA